MNETKVTDAVRYIGVHDKTLDLFESQYAVPFGMTYNSYVILDDKIAVMDTVDERATKAWISNLRNVLDGKTPDYLVISHMEPDHAANVKYLAELYPNMKIVANAKEFAMIEQFFGDDYKERGIVVKENDTLSLGTHTLQFIMAPMVHWPEVMVTYEKSEQILFSADAFGRFGGADPKEEWTDEARRYYINIVGKYGKQVQMLLKKLSGLPVSKICSLHGAVLDSDIDFYLGKYDTWSSYRPEEEGVFIAYASIYGHTKEAAIRLAQMLKKQGSKVVLCDLTREDISGAAANAFRYDKMVLACSTYDGSLFPPMEAFLHRLKVKNYQNRKVALIENGTWAPMAKKLMRTYMESMKDVTICDTMVSIKSALKQENLECMETLAKELSDNRKKE